MGRIYKQCPSNKKNHKNRYNHLGAQGQARTGDPFLFREMLFQLSYLGVSMITMLTKKYHLFNARMLSKVIHKNRGFVGKTFYAILE